jgi:hypothetical protein
VKTLGDVDEPFGNGKGRLLVLYNTRTGNQEEIAGLCKV